MKMSALLRGISAVGISLAVAATAAVPAAYAQPQQLPGPQTQAPQYRYQQPQYQGPQYPYGQPSYRGPQYPYGQPQYGQSGPPDRRNGESRAERRLSVLHQRLGITPAQEAAWTAFAGEMRNAAMSTGRTREAQPEGRGSANVIERLEGRQRMLETRGAELDRMIRALRPLYASFSDEQKRVADQLLFRPDRGGGFEDRTRS